MRRTALCCVVAALAATTHAAATPPKPRTAPSCTSFRDDRGDAGFLVLTDPSIDILGGAVVPGRIEPVARLDVADARSTGQWDRLGRTWDLGATFAGVDYLFSRRVDGNGVQTTSVEVGNTSPAHTFKIEGNSLVWRIKRSDVPSLNKRPGAATWSELHATTTMGGNTTDTATGRSGCSKGAART